MERESRHYFIYMPAVLIFSILIFQLPSIPIGDFANYFYGSKFLTEARFTLSVYDVAQFNTAVRQEGLQNFFLSYTAVPPITAFLFMPLVWLPIYKAKIVWAIFNAILFLLIQYRLINQFKVNHWIVSILPILFFMSLKSNIYQGQLYILISYLYLEGILNYINNKKGIASVLWSVTIVLKLFPVIILVFLLFKKDFKTTLSMILFCIFLIGFSIIFIDPDVWIYYLNHILPRISAGDINNTFAINYQSMQVLLKNLFVYDKLHNPSPYFNSPFWYYFLLSAFITLILTLLFSFSKKKQVSAIQLFAVWILGGLVISGYGSTYGLMQYMVLIPLINGFNKKNLVLLFLLFLSIQVPSHGLNNLPFGLQFIRLYFSLILFAFFIFYDPVKLNFTYLLLMIPVYFFKNNTPIEQNYLLEKETSILISDLRIENNRIRYHEWNEMGRFEKDKIVRFIIYKNTDLPDTGLYSRSIHLINDSILYYLSDKGRGVGFYTIRVQTIKPHQKK